MPYRATRITQKAAGVGFDWEAPAGARDKIAEELAELDEAVAGGDQAAITHELGDLILAAVNFSRLLGVDSEDALGHAIGRFTERFNYVEDRLDHQGQRPADRTLDELEDLWTEAKRRLPTK